MASLPQLNESASLRLSVDATGAARVLSFCRWLAVRGANSVQKLTLRLWNVEAAADVAPPLGEALAACGGGALRHACIHLRLRHACIHLPRDLLERLGAWVAALRDLRILELGGGGGVSRSLARLSQLEALALEGVGLWAAPPCRPPSSACTCSETPPGRCRSRCGCRGGCRWPRTRRALQPSCSLSPARCSAPQVSALTRLETLSISATDYSWDSMAPLERLPCLRSAAFGELEALPACLSRLTGLQRLCLHSQAVCARDADALPRLSQFTCLVLNAVTDEDEALAAALQQAPQLHALAWFVCGPYGPQGYGQQPVLAVPGGPWLGSLQQLEADVGDVAAMLPSATSLQQLSLAHETWWHDREEGEQQLAGVLRCAAALPLLRDISVHVDWSTPPPASALEALAGSRARLQWVKSNLQNDLVLERPFFEDVGGACAILGYLASVRM